MRVMIKIIKPASRSEEMKSPGVASPKVLAIKLESV